jgi:NIMA (never in mitosis gene a)-related kinase
MDQYQLIKNLGSGGFGIASQYSKKSSGEIYCIKQIDLKKGGLTINEAQEEFNLMNKFHHPNIIQSFELLIENKFLYIVIEFIDGGNLKEKIEDRSSPFKESFVLEVFTQLALALSECRKKKILHCNIKPENIFITKEGHIKLGDFGCGCLLDPSLQNAKTLAGTISYMHLK